MKPMYKPWIAYTFYILILTLAAWAICDAKDFSVSIITTVAIGYVVFAAIAFHIPYRPYLRERSAFRLLELSSNLNVWFPYQDVPVNPLSILTVEWEENKMYASVYPEEGVVRVSEKWLFNHGNMHQRFFLMRWCRHFYTLRREGKSIIDAELQADLLALKDCDYKKYDMQKIYYFFYDAFATYPHRMTTTRIKSVTDFLDQWKLSKVQH